MPTDAHISSDIRFGFTSSIEVLVPLNIKFDGDTVDESGECRLEFETNAVFIMSPPIEPPPPEVIEDSGGNVYYQTVNEVYPAPTLNSRGLPVDWRPTSVTENTWGRVRVLVNGRDMTYYRGVPCQINSMSDSDPFGDRALSVTFPQITPFDDHEAILPPYAEVRVERVLPNETTTQPLWDGLIIGYNRSSDASSFSLSIECIGAFYYLDLMLTRPLFVKIYDDVGHLIADSTNLLIQVTGANMSLINRPRTGFVMAPSSIGEKVVTEGWRSMLGMVQETAANQWTISCHNRRPRTHRRDVSTIHHQVRVGQPGVSISLEQDLVVPNTIIGEGVDPDHCAWRNTKYPGLNDAPPVWPGYNLAIGSTDASTSGAVTRWQTRMKNIGWMNQVTGVFSQLDRDETIRLQYFSGVSVDGIVGPQTWLVTFDPGLNSASLNNAWIAPLHSIPEVNIVTYTADGAISGQNPRFDRSIPRIDAFINYGSNIRKSEAIRSAKNQVDRYWYDKGWFGTITLDVDPESGSRWSIRSGQNIRLRNFNGENLLFHIADVTKDFANGTVTLTVDTKARDLLSIAQAIERNRSAMEDPAHRLTIGRRTSNVVEDRQPVWDCESGAGIIHHHGIHAGLWNVIRIPAGEYGEVVATDFRAEVATELAVAVFDGPITANALRNHGSPTDEDFWKTMPDAWEGKLLIGWGGGGQMGGYFPGRQSDEDPPTGHLYDGSSWYFHSRWAPWLWVAIWSPVTTYISGRLFPGSGEPGNLPRYGTHYGAPLTVDVH